jgi:hypothetical protein
MRAGSGDGASRSIDGAGQGSKLRQLAPSIAVLPCPERSLARGIRLASQATIRRPAMSERSTARQRGTKRVEWRRRDSNPRPQESPGSLGAGDRTRTCTPLREEDFKTDQKGRRINVYLIRRPVPFPRSTRSALQSEEYGHPGGHLSRRGPSCGASTLN